MIVGAVVFFAGTMFGVVITLAFGQAVIAYSKAGRVGGTPKTATTTGRQVGHVGKSQSGPGEARVQSPHDPPRDEGIKQFVFSEPVDIGPGYTCIGTIDPNRPN